jgi:hypothetical protein
MFGPVTTAVEYPPMQVLASFNLSRVKDKLMARESQ